MQTDNNSMEILPWLNTPWRRFTDQINQGRLPHALLLSGAEGLGKRQLAHALGQYLLCQQSRSTTTDMSGDCAQVACGHCDSCQLMAAGTHPDFYLIQPCVPEKSSSKAKFPTRSIKIDAIREMCESLGQTSQLGGYRIAIIEEADHMGVNAANSLLKTLEEPGENTLIVLTTDRLNRLPITIVSRCQHIKIANPTFQEVADWLLQKTALPDKQTCFQVFQQNHAAPLRALKYVEEQSIRDLLTEALTARLQQRSPLALAPKLAQENRQQLLGWMLDWVNDVIYLTADINSERIVNPAHREVLTQLALALQTPVASKRLFGLRDEILQLREQQSIALNLPLLWENLLISWDSLWAIAMRHRRETSQTV